MDGRVIGSVVIALLLLSAVWIGSRLARRRVHATMFVAPPLGAARPSDYGIAYDELFLPLADRVLHAWFAPAADARAAVLFFHGQNDALSSLVAVIDRLHQHQITVMVFNYSGHGKSTGRPTIETVRADCAAAYAEFQARVGSASQYAIGYSLGAAVVLDAIRHHAMKLDGLVLASPFASIRAVAVADGLPRWLAGVVPDVYNNVRAIAEVPCRVRIVQSATDGTFPLWMAQALQDANPAADLHVVASPLHAEVLAASGTIGDRANAYWQAIIDFITLTPG
jgi:uncharacterized protein